MRELLVPLELVVAASAYALLVARAGTRSGHHIGTGRTMCFLAGVGVLAFAIVGPVEPAADRDLSWHMVQHLLIVSVAAPLLALGRPVQLVLDALPAQLGRPRVNWRRPWSTAVAGLVGLATLLIWHLPSLYDTALRDEAVHVAEHASLIASAMLLWATLLGHRRLGESVLWLFVLTLPLTAFGVAMTIAGTPWYPHYVISTRAAAVRDQQLAGVIMWAFGGLAALIGAVGLFAAWLVDASGSTDEPNQRRATIDRVPRC